jgi:hypothetical protein
MVGWRERERAHEVLRTDREAWVREVAETAGTP